MPHRISGTSRDVPIYEENFVSWATAKGRCDDEDEDEHDTIGAGSVSLEMSTLSQHTNRLGICCTRERKQG